MVTIVLYDISGSSRRLTHVRKICERWGIRIQKSAYECSLDYSQYRSMVSELDEDIEPDKDSVVLYTYGSADKKKCERLGKTDDFEEQRNNYVI